MGLWSQEWSWLVLLMARRTALAAACPAGARCGWVGGKLEGARGAWYEPSIAMMSGEWYCWRSAKMELLDVVSAWEARGWRMLLVRWRVF